MVAAEYSTQQFCRLGGFEVLAITTALALTLLFPFLIAYREYDIAMAELLKLQRGAVLSLKVFRPLIARLLLGQCQFKCHNVVIMKTCLPNSHISTT
jgi:hypothetical protein